MKVLVLMDFSETEILPRDPKPYACMSLAQRETITLTLGSLLGQQAHQAHQQEVGLRLLKPPNLPNLLHSHPCLLLITLAGRPFIWAMSPRPQPQLSARFWCPCIPQVSLANGSLLASEQVSYNVEIPSR